jgi:hypothetical protein
MTKAEQKLEDRIFDWIENQEEAIRDGIEPEGTATRDNAIEAIIFAYDHQNDATR